MEGRGCGISSVSRISGGKIVKENNKDLRRLKTGIIQERSHEKGSGRGAEGREERRRINETWKVTRTGYESGFLVGDKGKRVGEECAKNALLALTHWRCRFIRKILWSEEGVTRGRKTRQRRKGSGR